MARFILMILVVGMLISCMGAKPPDIYTDRNGATTVIESDREQCVHACNDTYDSCMDSYGARHSGVNGPSGMFGGSADCRSDLKDCLPACQGR